MTIHHPVTRTRLIKHRSDHIILLLKLLRCPPPPTDKKLKFLVRLTYFIVLSLTNFKIFSQCKHTFLDNIFGHIGFLTPAPNSKDFYVPLPFLFQIVLSKQNFLLQIFECLLTFQSIITRFIPIFLQLHPNRVHL